MALNTGVLALGENEEDRLDRLAATARNIAGPADAEIVLFHVFDEDQYEELRTQLDLDADATPDRIAQRYRTVGAVSEEFDDHDRNVSVRGAIGEKGGAIVRSANDSGSDLVVIWGDHRSPTRKAVFGSTAQEVLLNDQCPVTVVRASEETPEPPAARAVVDVAQLVVPVGPERTRSPAIAIAGKSRQTGRSQEGGRDGQPRMIQGQRASTRPQLRRAHFSGGKRRDTSSSLSLVTVSMAMTMISWPATSTTSSVLSP